MGADIAFLLILIGLYILSEIYDKFRNYINRNKLEPGKDNRIKRKLSNEDKPPLLEDYETLSYEYLRKNKEGLTPSQKHPKLTDVDTHSFFDTLSPDDQKSLTLALKRLAFNRQDYLDYLDTEEWLSKKLQRFEIDKGCCQSCGKQLAFEISHCHHKDYLTLYEELMDSIETLCRPCHNSKHN